MYVCVYTHICMYTCVYGHTYMYTRVYVSVCGCVYLWMYTYSCVYICLYMCIHVCMCIWVSMCIYVGGWVYLYVCVNLHIACMCIHVFLHLCGSQRSMLSIFFHHSLPYFLNQGLSLNSKLTDTARLSGQ